MRLPQTFPPVHVLGIAVLLVALLAPAVARGNAFDDVLADYRTDGKVEACAYTRDRLIEARAQVPAQVVNYQPDVLLAINAAIARHDRGECAPPAPLVVPPGAGGSPRPVGSAIAAGRWFSVTVACPAGGANCVGALSVRVKLYPRHGAPRRISLGARTFYVAAGARRLVEVTMGRVNRGRVARARKAVALLEIVSRDAAGNESRKSFSRAVR